MIKIKKIPEHSDFDENFEVTWHAAKNGNDNAKRSLIRSYQDGIKTQKNVALALYWSRRLQHKNKSDFLRYVDLLLTSERDEDHKEAYSICKKFSEKQDGWFRHTLALMIWNGIGTERNRDEAKKIMNQCKDFFRAFPVEPLYWLCPKIFDFDKIYIYGNLDSVRNIFCTCFQNNLQVNGVIINDSDCDFTAPAELERINPKNLHTLKNCALLTCSDEFLRSEHRLDNSCTPFVYKTDETECDYDSLLVLNDRLNNFQNFVIVYDDGQKIESLTNSLKKTVVPKTIDYMTLSEFENYLREGFENKSQDAYLILADIDWALLNYIASKRAVRDRLFLDYTPKHADNICLIRNGGIIRQFDLFEKFTFNYSLGKKIYDELPDNVNYFMSSMEAMGDQYRIMCKTHALSEYYNLESPCVLVNSRAKDLPNLFGYNGIIFNNNCFKALLQFIKTNKYFDKGKVTVWGPRIASNAGTRTSSYQPTLHLPVGIARENTESSTDFYGYPNFIPYDSILFPEIKEPLKEEDFQGGVLINPYGNTIKRLAPKFSKRIFTFFEKLAEKLIENKIPVYTNSIGDLQPPIAGTKAFCGSISDTISISNNLRAIVTVFTGFMETVIFTDADLYVITPSKKESRKFMAQELHKKNYEEFTLVQDDLNNIVNTIFAKIMSNTFNLPGKVEKEKNSRVFSNKISFKRCTSEYIELCNEHPEWKNMIFSELFSVSDDKESADIIDEILELSQYDKVAMYFMGRLFESGKILNKNNDEAILWMRKAVLNNAEWARNELFDMLWKRDAPGDSEEMISIITPFAEKNDGNAMGRLGRAYRHGRGVEQNLDLAIVWMRRAAEENIGWARNELFDMQETKNKMLNLNSDKH